MLPSSSDVIPARLRNESLAEAGIEPSVGSAGYNALAETVIGLFETEVIGRRGPWRGREAVDVVTFGWVDWFNTDACSSRSEKSCETGQLQERTSAGYSI